MNNTDNLGWVTIHKSLNLLVGPVYQTEGRAVGSKVDRKYGWKVPLKERRDWVRANYHIVPVIVNKDYCDEV